MHVIKLKRKYAFRREERGRENDVIILQSRIGKRKSTEKKDQTRILSSVVWIGSRETERVDKQMTNISIK